MELGEGKQMGRRMGVRGGGQRALARGGGKAWGFLQSQVDFFRACGILVNPREAAKGTDAFKRANEKEKNEPGQFCSS